MPADTVSGGMLGPPATRIRTRVLQSYARLLRLVLDETRDAVVVFDARGDVILANRALERLIDPWPVHGYAQITVPELLQVLGAEIDSATLGDLLEARGGGFLDLALEDGARLECHVSALSLESPGDHRLMLLRDGGASDDELSELRHRAFHDRLTGLPNRELLLDRLEQALARLGRDGGAVGLIFIDLDGFKPINDEHGHATGDRVLEEVARRLALEMRQVDTVGRLGGDEFVVVCDGVAETRAIELICSRVQAALCAPYLIDGVRINLGASLGAVLEWTPGSEPAELLARADEQMYEAKRSGSRIEIATAGERTDMRSARRAAQLSSLRGALSRDELELVYLPLVSLGDARVLAVEALLRCSTPDLSGVGAGELIDLAEEAGMIEELTAWVLGEAARAVAEMGRGSTEDLGVIVNLSGAQLADPDLPERVSDAARSAGIERHLLSFDVAENVLMSGLADIEDQLVGLARLGCRLFADDVTGPAVPLEQLGAIGFSGLKIAGPVIAAAGEISGAADTIGALIHRAQDLRLSVVGEGVADERTLVTARRLGCNGAQGYGFYGFPRSLAGVKAIIE